MAASNLCRLTVDKASTIVFTWGLMVVLAVEVQDQVSHLADGLHRGGDSAYPAAGAAVGCVGVEQASPVTCYMERLSVLPEHRGNGYGTHLARHAVNRAKEMGATTVGIGIIAADTGLKHFYTTLGFKAGETQSFAHLPFEVAFLTILV